MAAKQSFQKMHWLTTMQTHTTFGYKRLNSSEDTVLTKFNEILNLCCDHDHGNWFTGYSGLWWCPIKQSLIRRYNRNSLCGLLEPYDLDCVDNNPTCLAWYSAVMMCHRTQFGYKSFSSSEDVIQTNISWTFECSLWTWPRQLFPPDHWLMMNYHQTKFGCERIVSSGVTGKSYFHYI